MSEEYLDFIKNIEPNIDVFSGETVFDSLFREYEHVVFRSILTAFGLEQFIKDRHGGDVDTIHNVRSIDTDTNLTYKNPSNASTYESRGKYSHKLVEQSGTNFQQTKHEARIKYSNDNTNGTVQDAYEDKPLGFLGRSKRHPTEKSAELDHVISASSIHNDRGRVLSGLSTVELADAKDNLKWTNEHLNKSMRADEIPVYISSHPELPDSVKERMMSAYSQSKASYEKKILHAYYFDFRSPQCRKFYKDALSASYKRGLQMGLRQLLGFLIVELWFDVSEEIDASDKTINGVFDAIVRGSNKWRDNVRKNYAGVFAQFGEGVLSGIIASLTTTLFNTFLTTSESMGRIIRQAWSSIVEAASILIFNSKDEYLCDRITSSAKILATGACLIIGSGVQDAVRIQLVEVPIPDDIKMTLSTFMGCLCTGLLTVSMLFYIDNNPFGEFLKAAYAETINNLQEQGRLFREYCAKLQGIDLHRLESDADYVYGLSVKLQNAITTTQMNSILKQALKDLNLHPIWGDGSLDEKVNDPNWVLQFD